MEIKKIGIVGQGALGVMYGNYLKKRMGNENVFFIADEGRVNRYRSADMVCNGEACGFSYRSPAEAVTADLIIFAVKFMGMNWLILLLLNSVSIVRSASSDTSAAFRISELMISSKMLQTFGSPETRSEMV